MPNLMQTIEARRPSSMPVLANIAHGNSSIVRTRLRSNQDPMVGADQRTADMGMESSGIIMPYRLAPTAWFWRRPSGPLRCTAADPR
jgi:formyltetrahydrofolate synthetase